MSRDATIGIILMALLFGGIFLFARRPAAVEAPIATFTPRQLSSGQGNMRFVPVQTGPPRYRNKEIRNIEYNADGLPTRIEITRDYTVA